MSDKPAFIPAAWKLPPRAPSPTRTDRLNAIRARAEKGKALVGLGIVPNIVAQLIDDIEYLLALTQGEDI